MKKFRTLLCAATVIIIGMSSCSKGTTGPAGPAGPAGPDSVIYSNWIALNFTYNTTDSSFEDTILAPNITQAVLDSGLIISYIQFTDQFNIEHIESIASLGSFLFEDFSLGKIDIVAPQVDLTNYLYRYVIIPGSKAAGNSAASRKVNGYTTAELKAMSYAQVQQVLADKN
ncbi:MAG TPA: hypothetical protein VII44_08445 [Puia sp.]